VKNGIPLEVGSGLIHNMTKGIIYYTDNKLSEPLFSLVKGKIAASGLHIVSASLQPMLFGDNKVIMGEPGYITMMKQIISCLERSHEDYVFFCEHDVLYPLYHFDFIPPRDDIFYYNENVWRWQIGSDKVIRYDRMLPLSCLCVSRALALKYYLLRERKINEAGMDAFNSHEPALARRWGYEPGTKKRKRGGLTDDDFATWYSYRPVIDVRHKGAFSPPKVTLDSFRHAPENWTERQISEIVEWPLKDIVIYE
jgi:hypothetical protein